MNGTGMNGEGNEIGAENSGVAGGTQHWRVMPREETKTQGIPLGTLAASNIRVKKRRSRKSLKPRTDENSELSAATVRWNGPVHQKIIGRTVTVAGVWTARSRCSMSQRARFAAAFWKRKREWQEALKTNTRERVWEYQLGPQWRVVSDEWREKKTADPSLRSG